MSRKNRINYRDMISQFFTPTPKDVEGLNNESYFYYQNQLLLKLYSIFQFKNIPDHWNQDYIKDVLFKQGIMYQVEKDNQIWLLGTGGYYGINMYNFPTHINIANPVLGTFNREIGKNGELIYFNRVNGHFQGVMPLITRYAVLLAQCDASINVSLMNSRVAHVFTTTDKSMSESLKVMYDKVTNGEPFVILNKGSLEMAQDVAIFNNVKNTYIANDILVTKRTLINEFLTEIGIMNANTDKRERLNTDEVNANNGETMALCSLWLDTLNKCFDRSNKLFNMNVKVKFNEKVIQQYQKQIKESSDVND